MRTPQVANNRIRMRCLSPQLVQYTQVANIRIVTSRRRPT